MRDTMEFCMAIMCLKRHKVVKGLRYHNIEHSDYPLGNEWMHSLANIEREEVLTWLEQIGLPPKYTHSFWVDTNYDDTYTVSARVWVRNRVGDIMINDGVPLCQDEYRSNVKSIPSPIEKALQYV